MAHNYTWSKLVQGATRLNPKSRGRNYPGTPKFEICTFTSGVDRGLPQIVPFVGTKSCVISLRAWGVTQASLHAITLCFHDVDIQTEDPHSYNYFQVKYDDKMYWIQKFDMNRHPLTSRCSCKDFFFSFAFHNYNAGCLYGPRPKMYKRLTTTRPPRNPAGIIGCCKHVFNAWVILRNSGMTIN